MCERTDHLCVCVRALRQPLDGAVSLDGQVSGEVALPQLSFLQEITSMSENLSLFYRLVTS